jgi:hypothetical protein
MKVDYELDLYHCMQIGVDVRDRTHVFLGDLVLVKCEGLALLASIDH